MDKKEFAVNAKIAIADFTSGYLAAKWALSDSLRDLQLAGAFGDELPGLADRLRDLLPVRLKELQEAVVEQRRDAYRDEWKHQVAAGWSKDPDPTADLFE